LKKDLEDLGSRLEEAGANTATQVELNKKREGELGRLKVNLLGLQDTGYQLILLIAG